jgi:hypothetical protein
MQGTSGTLKISSPSIVSDPPPLTTTWTGWRRLAERPSQSDELGMPRGKDDRRVGHGAGAGHDGIGIDSRQAFVDQVLVRVAATEGGGVLNDRVPLA